MPDRHPIESAVSVIRPDIHRGIRFTRRFDPDRRSFEVVATQKAYAVASASRRCLLHVPIKDSCVYAALRELAFIKTLLFCEQFTNLSGWPAFDPPGKPVYVLALSAVVESATEAMRLARLNELSSVCDLWEQGDVVVPSVVSPKS